jgi:hypothetical protein
VTVVVVVLGVIDQLLHPGAEMGVLFHVGFLKIPAIAILHAGSRVMSEFR